MVKGCQIKDCHWFFHGTLAIATEGPRVFSNRGHFLSLVFPLLDHMVMDTGGVLSKVACNGGPELFASRVYSRSATLRPVVAASFGPPAMWEPFWQHSTSVNIQWPRSGQKQWPAGGCHPQFWMWQPPEDHCFWPLLCHCLLPLVETCQKWFAHGRWPWAIYH